MPEETQTTPVEVNKDRKWIVILTIVISALFLSTLTLAFFLLQNNEDDLQTDLDRISLENQRLAREIAELEQNQDEENIVDEKEEGNDEEPQEQPQKIYEDTFDGTTGKFTATGYVTTKQVEQAWCETDCDVYTYAFFNITSTTNQAISKFFSENQGNSYVGNNSIGIGCVENGKLEWINDSDAYPMKEYTLTVADTETLLESDSGNLVKVEFEKYKFTGGSGAPTCYSHFGGIKVVD